MHNIINTLLSVLREIFVGRAALHMEILALRQQVTVLKRKRPRPSLQMADRVFWVILSCLWAGWRHSLVIVRPETVIGSHRKGFRLFWTWKSRRGKPGRPPVSREIRELIRRMSQENTGRGAPRIHGELFKLGFSNLPVRRLEIHAPLPLAALAIVADIPDKSRRLPGINRLFRVPHRHISPAVWVHCAPPRAPPDRAFRGNGEPDRGLGSTADSRRLSVGHGTAVSDPRPGAHTGNRFARV